MFIYASEQLCSIKTTLCVFCAAPTAPAAALRESADEGSSVAWAEQQPYIIGTYKMFPLDCSMQQRLILRYLTPMGEYQELLTHVFRLDAIELIFYYLDLSKNKDARLAFEATKVCRQLRNGLVLFQFSVYLFVCGVNEDAGA